MFMLVSQAWKRAPYLVLATLTGILASTVSSLLTPTVSAWYLIPIIGITLALLVLSLRGIRLAPYLLGGLSLVAAVGQALTLDPARLSVVVLKLLAVGLVAAHLAPRHRDSSSRSE